jgi:tetratricopeptide (TPR) repeat protein
MSEEVESGTSDSIDPVAVSLALAGASRDKADAFLDEQRHHLREQLIQLRLGIWEKRLGVLLRIATAFIGVAVAAGIAYLIWNAANSNDLVIDSFAVPPDLVDRGLSGPVVAAKLSDRIAAMQADTRSQRPAKSYTGLADGLKLEIPETGVSLSELDRFLREKLGHDQHIGGEVVRTDTGVALTVRVGSDGSATVTGGQAEMDKLLQTLAEQVYRITQPYRYSIWLMGHDRVGEGVAILKSLAARGPAKERAWAYDAWGAANSPFQGETMSLDLLRRGHALDPNSYLLIGNVAGIEYRLGRAQDSQRDFGAALAALLAHGRDYSDRLSGSEHGYREGLLTGEGALLEAADQTRKAIAAGADAGLTVYYPQLAERLAALHEPDAARTALAEFPSDPANRANAGAILIQVLHARMTVALASRDWPGAVATDRALSQALAQYPGFAESRATYFDPVVALALAHMGQFAAAEARLKPMPADCYRCMIVRAQVAELEGQHARADWWFGRAAAAGPSLPYAESEWGRALLNRGQPDAAIVKFAASNRRGPHFADPLEGWGEALMAKNQSHLALAKFAEAEKYAPNWGRLHLKWGEALYYAGKKDEARKRFARAATLDLTAAERRELSGMSHG